MTKKVQIEVEELKATFDIAVHSMDFGSGFLDNEEVEHLRKVAEILGLDPMDATPRNFRKQYPHAFTPFPEHYDRSRGHYNYCYTCQADEDHEVHSGHTE